MISHASATSAGEPRKFGAGLADRFQTNTWNPAVRSPAATWEPMIPRPIRPTFFRDLRGMANRRESATSASSKADSVAWTRQPSMVYSRGTKILHGDSVAGRPGPWESLHGLWRVREIYFDVR